eukprot:gene31850-7056_t
MAMAMTMVLRLVLVLAAHPRSTGIRLITKYEGTKGVLKHGAGTGASSTPQQYRNQIQNQDIKYTPAAPESESKYRGTKAPSKMELVLVLAEIPSSTRIRIEIQRYKGPLKDGAGAGLAVHLSSTRIRIEIQRHKSPLKDGAGTGPGSTPQQCQNQTQNRNTEVPRGSSKMELVLVLAAHPRSTGIRLRTKYEGTKGVLIHGAGTGAGSTPQKYWNQTQNKIRGYKRAL